MKIVEPSVEIMHSGLETELIRPEQHIERVGRTCYKSEDKITEDSAEAFAGRFIKWGHESVLEHWTYIFKTEVLWYEQILEDWEMLLHNLNIPLNNLLRPFLRFTDQTVNDESRCIISGNIRAWRDYCKACIEGFGFIPGYLYDLIKTNPIFFPEYQNWVPINISNRILEPITVKDLVGKKEHDIHHDVTVKFTCDRGVSHEIVRHRTASYAQESTRYCNYAMDKFGNEITVVRPSWCKADSDIYHEWEIDCINAEGRYFTLMSMGAKPQEARSVLPNSLKTELVMTTNLQGWDHFFYLRSARDAHPDIREISDLTQELFDIDIYGATMEAPIETEVTNA